MGGSNVRRQEQVRFSRIVEETQRFVVLPGDSTLPSRRPPCVHMAAFARGDQTLLMVFDERENTTSMMVLTGL